MSVSLLAAEGVAAASPSFPILSAVVLTPAVGAVLVALVSRRRPEIAKQVAALFSVATGALTIGVLVLFKTSEAGYQLIDRTTWIKDPEISWALGVDGIALWLVVLSGILFPIAMIGAPPKKDVKSFYVWMLILEAGCLGSFLAKDLFLFFLFFEVVLVPMYFLIAGWGYEQRKYAATKFFLFTMFGSAFMLVGIVATAYLHAKGGPVTFDLQTLAENQGILATTTSRWLFLAFAIGFAVKVPLFPVHTWLPDAHTQAPTAGSVILAGILLKLGTYGFLRFGLYLFPEAAVWAAPGMVTLGVIGIIYGAIAAAMQHNLKRIIAYSSVAHLGFIALGTFALTTQGIQGSVFQMVAHGITTGCLFMLCGLIHDRRHTYDLSKLRGLQKPAPILAGIFTVAMMASIGLPGLNGFVGEFVILQGAFLTRRWWAVTGVIGVIIAALYLLWAYQRVFHGEPDAENAAVSDLSFTQWLPMVPLLAIIVFMGVYPKPIFDRIAPSADRLVSHVEDNSDYRQPPVATEGEDIVPEADRRPTDGDGERSDAGRSDDDAHDVVADQEGGQ